MDSTSNEVGVGGVVRDHMGGFFSGLSKVGCKVSSTEISELVAAREVLSFAWEAGFRDVILEGDNLSVMNAIRANEFGLLSRGHLLKIFSA